jgi:photosystem II stability/assembly factor-like uncharacterized protein
MLKSVLFFLLLLFTSLLSDIPRKIENVKVVLTPGNPYVINPNITKEIRFKFRTNNSSFDFKKTQFAVKFIYNNEIKIIKGVIDSISIQVQKNYRKGHLFWELYVDSVTEANKIIWGAVPCASPHFSIDSSRHEIINDSLNLYFTLVNRNHGYESADLQKPLEVFLKTKSKIIAHQISNYYRIGNKDYNRWEKFDFHFKTSIKDEILYIEVDPDNSFIKVEDEYLFPFYNGFKSQNQLNRELAIALANRTVTVQNPVPVHYDVKGIYFLNDHKGWVLGRYDIILETNDGGLSWSTRYLSELDPAFEYEKFDYHSIEISSIYFIDERNGWIIAQNKKNLGIFRTKDGGEAWNWIKISKPLGEITSLFFIDENHGWFIGGNVYQMDWEYDSKGIVGITNDGGKTWDIREIRNTKNPRAQFSFALKIGPLLTDVHFIDKQTGWAVGGDQLLKTSDGGITWEKYELDADRSYYLKRIQFVSDEIGWIAGEYRKDRNTFIGLFKTVDGGKTWEFQEINSHNPTRYFSLNDMHFYNEQFGFIVGDENNYKKPVLLYTKDGQKWNIQKNQFNQVLNHIRILDRSKLIAANSAAMYLSHDKGKNWKLVNSATDADLYDVLAIDEKNVIAVGEKGTLIETKNGGFKWNKVAIKTKSNLNKIVKGPNNTIWVVGNSGAVLKKVGDNWSIQSAPVSTNLNSIQFLSDNVGYIAGDKSTFLISVDSGLNWKSFGNFGSKDLNIKGLCFINSTTGFLYVYEKKDTSWIKYFLKTTDGGKSWSKIKSKYKGDHDTYTVYQNSDSFFFTNSKNGYSATRFGFYESSDSGISWKRIEIDSESSHSFVNFKVINNELMAVLDKFGALYIVSGTNWQKIILKHTRLLNSISFINDNIGWVAGNNGYIWKIDLSNQDLSIHK